jgi:hypothetical protein
MKKIFTPLSYASAFTLGLYASSQFIFNQPIEIYRWVITSFCFLLFLSLKQPKKD